MFAEEKKFNAINGEMTDPGDVYFAYYVDGKITSGMPSQNTGYKIDAEKSECTNAVIPKWDYALWEFRASYSNYNATNYTRTICNLYFIKESTISIVLGNLTINSYIPDFSKSACDDSTCESHEKGIFMVEDDYGTSLAYGLRPVINLKNTLKFSGDGTKNNPYVPSL